MALSNIGKGAVISYIAIFINIAISFLYTPWMLRQIGTSDYGLYNLIISFMSYFTLDFGISITVARFIAKYRAEGDDKKVENIIGLSLKIFFVIDVVIFLCLFVCYFFIADIFKGLTLEEISKLKVLYIISGTFSILSFGLKPLDGVLVAYEYFVPAKVTDMVYKVGSVLFVVVALLLGGDIYILVLINGALAFLTQLYKFIYWHRKTNLSPNLRFKDRAEQQSLFSFSGWTFLGGLAHRFRLGFVSTILGIFSNSEQIAIFSLGMVMEAMTWTLSSALNGLFLPKVSRLAVDNNNTGIMELMIRVGRIQLYIIFAIFSVIVLFGKPFIDLWVGDKFADVYYIVICLTFAHLLGNTLQIAVDKAYADNKIKHLTRVTFTTSLIGLVFSCMLAEQFGAVGCAICSGIALFLTQLCYLYIYQKKLDINMSQFFSKCHLRILPILVPFVVPFYFLYNFIDCNSWLCLIVMVGIYILCYTVVVYRILLNDYEKEILSSVIRK